MHNFFLNAPRVILIIIYLLLFHSSINAQGELYIEAINSVVNGLLMDKKLIENGDTLAFKVPQSSIPTSYPRNVNGIEITYFINQVNTFDYEFLITLSPLDYLDSSLRIGAEIMKVGGEAGSYSLSEFGYYLGHWKFDCIRNEIVNIYSSLILDVQLQDSTPPVPARGSSK